MSTAQPGGGAEQDGGPVVPPVCLGDGHPLTGRSAPDLQLEDGTRLGELLRDGRGLALDLTADRRLPDVALSRPGRLRHTAGTAKNDLGPGAVLVRPDGFVAWAGDRDFDPRAFERAADQWFGASAN
ncbi:hypothetical protein ACFYWU_22530 [Streptomyces chrestomyceticus]|uniref:aromatic-ring hydroxylase C-terminal domain-containing protein n=1 Tax=Streptomyces chrestomyceticus TaxID=68185 RepID=UPI003677ED72